ncbi:MarR family winged helix-turn-helix transcriptional regulator [Glutamicibacter sp. JC586]|uniref:MarR family winged helix-turn-helix transcriptional regulator n=1 Tax=Glutamicibacter sp. JC586 TaxID=2590552 RepID=UPI00135BF32A|nr:MarR family transcriptional regulator [Glutamicibacter sp. JC586]
MSDEPVWLNQSERDAWLGLQTVMTLLPSALDSDLQGLDGITLFDYHMLAMLSEARDHQMSMTDLASRTSASLSRLSHVVKKLETRGWLLRVQSPDDARVKIASLTNAGYQAVVNMAPHHVASVRALLFEPLNDKDVKALARVTRKITASLQKDHWILKPGATDLED